MKRIVATLLLVFLAVGLAGWPPAAGVHGGAHGGFHEGGHGEFPHRDEFHHRQFGLGVVPYPY